MEKGERGEGTAGRSGKLRPAGGGTARVAGYILHQIAAPLAGQCSAIQSTAFYFVFSPSNPQARMAGAIRTAGVDDGDGGGAGGGGGGAGADAGRNARGGGGVSRIDCTEASQQQQSDGCSQSGDGTVNRQSIGSQSADGTTQAIESKRRSNSSHDTHV